MILETTILQKTSEISEELEDLIYDEFSELPLREKLVVYAKISYGNLFRMNNTDLFSLNRRAVNKMYKSFILSVKERVGVKKSNKTDIKPQAKRQTRRKN